MAKKKRDRGSKRWIVATGILVMFTTLLVFGSVVYYKQKVITKAVVRTDAAAIKVNQADIVGGEGSPKYNQSLKQIGDIESQEAKENGQSYIPPMIGDSELSDMLETKEAPIVVENAPIVQEQVRASIFPEPLQPLPTTEVNVPPPVEVVSEERAEVLKNAIMTELAQISNKMILFPHQTTVFKPLLEDKSILPTLEVSTGAVTKKTDQPKNLLAELRIRPGDVFYAVNGETLNTDTIAPVGTATILSGPLKNARVLGTFVKQNDYLVFQYNTLVLKNGEKHSMKGFAVDPSTKSAGVRSGVNHRYITRWGSLIASSFLEGFAEAVQQSGSKTSSNVGGDYGTTVTERPVYNTSEQVWIAAGKVGEKVGKKAEKYFDTPSTVTLKEGIPIGVLIIDIDKGVI
jgi:hypothetical protein